MDTAKEQVTAVQRILKRSHNEYREHYQLGLASLQKAVFLESTMAEIAKVVFPDDDASFTDEETECS